MISDQELQGRAREYAQRHGRALNEKLGSGVHGIVFLSESLRQKGDARARTAVKAHRQEPDYCRERDVYLRLQENGVTAMYGCHVPELLRYDDDLRIIEMTVVAQPFVLDFAGAFLDEAPDFSEEVMAEWRADKKEQFGGRWPEVERILRSLETYGIFFIDVSPKNIVLPVK